MIKLIFLSLILVSNSNGVRFHDFLSEMFTNVLTISKSNQTFSRTAQSQSTTQAVSSVHHRNIGDLNCQMTCLICDCAYALSLIHI